MQILEAMLLLYAFFFTGLFSWTEHRSRRAFLLGFSMYLILAQTDQVYIIPLTWNILLNQKIWYKSRGITKPRYWFGRDLGNLKFHGYARDRMRTSRNLPKLHGDHFNWDRDFKKKHGMGSGSRTFPRDQFGRERDFRNSAESRDYSVSRGFSRDFHMEKIPTKALDIVVPYRRYSHNVLDSYRPYTVKPTIPRANI